MINKILRPLIKRLPENNRIELIWKLAQVDFKKRYYNDSLGLFWALLNPIFRILIYFIVFTHVFQVKQENYAIFRFGGLILWITFTESCNKGLKLHKTKRYLIENIQFNHVDLYRSMILSTFIGFGFNLGIYFLALLVFGFTFTPYFFLLPLLIYNSYLISMGAAMLLTVIHIYIKDIAHLWTIIMLFGFWTSGVFLRGERFLEIFPALVYINPFVGIIMNMRAITFDGGSPDWYLMLIGYLWGFSILVIGRTVYSRLSHKSLEYQ